MISREDLHNRSRPTPPQTGPAARPYAAQEPRLLDQLEEMALTASSELRQFVDMSIESFDTPATRLQAANLLVAKLGTLGHTASVLLPDDLLPFPRVRLSWA